MAFSRGCLVDLGWKIKQKVTVPVSIAGRINNPELAEQILAEGKADFIALGRALHADPYWPKKTQEGHLDDIRICPACMSCSDQLATQLPITCSINPEAGRESALAIKQTTVKKNVLVIGGGPAGMEAARVAALRGHRVTLCEQQNRLGGQLAYAVKAPHKQEYGEVIRFLEGQLRKSTVDLRLGSAVTKKTIEEMKPDAVIFATGAVPIIPFTPGADKSHVYTAIDVLDERVSLKGETAVLGGGLVGMETALYLVEKEATPVIIIEPTDKLGGNVGFRTGWVVRNEISKTAEIEVRLKTTVEEIKDNSIILQSQGIFEEVPVKNVVLATGMRNQNHLAEQIKAEGTVGEFYEVGDCNIPRTVKEAIEEAALAARQV